MDTNERRILWNRIANSPAWKDFWLSEEVAKLETDITRKILSMNLTDPNQISFERGRLAALQMLRNFPSELLRIEDKVEKAREEQVNKLAEEMAREQGREERPWWQKVKDHLPRPTN